MKSVAFRANLVVGIGGLLFLMTYPFMEHPIMGLVAHMSGAAFIGGLADWYAVVALFRKPLGIPFKTALIPKRREQIIDIARKMVSEELLTKNNILKGLKGEKVLAPLLSFLQTPHMRNHITAIVENVWREPVVQKECESLGYMVLQKGQKGFIEWDCAPYVIGRLRHFGEGDRMDYLWAMIIPWARKLIMSPVMTSQVATILAASVDRYNEGGLFRNLVSSSMDPVKLAPEIQSAVSEYVSEQQSIHSPLGQMVKKKFLEYVDKLEQDESFHALCTRQKKLFIDRILVENTNQESSIVGLLNTHSLQDYIIDEVYKYLSSLQDEDKRKQAERSVLSILSSALSAINEWVGNTTAQSLGAFSGKAMSNMLEHSVSNDLQMIRINGSLVGATLGGIFYLLSILVKGVWS